MMNKIKMTISLILCTIFSLSFISCAKKNDGNSENSNSGSNTFENGYIINGRKQKIEESDNYLIKDGKSEYKILLKEDCSSAEYYAASELNEILEKVSGVHLDVIKENNVKDEDRIISIGNTKLAQKSGMQPIRTDNKNFNRNGFRIFSSSDDLYINASTNSGIIFGVYRFMEENLGYKYYNFDEIRYNKTETIKLKYFDYEDWPDFANRHAFSYDTMLDRQHLTRLYLTGSDSGDEKYGEGGWWATLHDTSLTAQLVPSKDYRYNYPDWYYGSNGNTTVDRPQICYTKALYDRDEYEKGDWSEENYADGHHGLFWTLVYNLINNYIIKEPDKSLFQLGMTDNMEYCDCERCKRDVDKYTKSGVAIRFANAVCDEVEKWRQENCPEREIYLTMFAYLSIVEPPVKLVEGKYEPIDPTVVARDNLVIRYAPINDSYLYPLMDKEHNSLSREALLGWSTIADHLAVWDYRVNFADLIMPYPSWVSMYDNLKTYYDLGFIDIFNQGCRTIPSTTFSAMDNWVRSRLLWNIHQDVKELINEFFDVYYDDAGKYMKEYMDFVTAHSMGYMQKECEWKGLSNKACVNSRCYPRGVCIEIKNIFDKAYNSIEKYKTINLDRYNLLKKRIDQESIFVRYLELAFYQGYYDEDKLLKMIDEFDYITTEAKFVGLMTSSYDMKNIIQNWRKSIRGY